jgi:hypothetical protein
VPGGDAGFEHSVAGGGQDLAGCAVGMLFLQCLHQEAEGVLDLPVGELVRAVLPVLGDAEPDLVGGGQRGQRLVHPGQVRGPAVGQGELHAHQ